MMYADVFERRFGKEASEAFYEVRTPEGSHVLTADLRHLMAILNLHEDAVHRIVRSGANEVDLHFTRNRFLSYGKLMVTLVGP